MNTYRHMFCKCGGIIGWWDRVLFTCDKCHKEYKLFDLDYDVVIGNPLTGDVFPMKIKETLCE